MAGVDSNRELFAKPPEQPRQALRGVGLLMVAGLFGLVAFVGYRMISESHLGASDGEAQDLEQIQQQLADMEKRMGQLEKRHKAIASEVAPVHAKNEAASTSSSYPPARPAYRVSAASVLKPQGNSGSPSLPATQAAVASSATTSATNNSREAWEATTNRLADVVEVVGEQQGQLTQARDAINQLLAQTRRSALSFELRRGATRMRVGPVSLLLRSVDPAAQRYTVCVYLENKCIELKDRAVNEVVVFVLSKKSAPLELIATKVSRGEIVGYLEVPESKDH